ncbi:MULTISPECIES: hypothetical protein [unclassified Ensifer]|uniref:hypothetical protein n=1 Tax=unclassified Ensifer TaxID=2633371 RepID=UPI000ABDF339|nr:MULTISPECIES: hypothetical protein [unclassified Ensifer]
MYRNRLASVRLVTGADGNLAEQTGYATFGERTNTRILKMKGTIPMWYRAGG